MDVKLIAPEMDNAQINNVFVKPCIIYWIVVQIRHSNII